MVKKLLLAAWVLIVPVRLAAQSIVPVHEEPRHRVAHETAAFRILDIQIPPGDTTLFHRHSTPIAYVSIGVSPVNIQPYGGEWGSATRDSPPVLALAEVRLNEGYYDSPESHRVATVGDDLFRLIAISNRGDAGQASTDLEIGPAGPAESEGGWFRSTRLTIAAGEVFEWTQHSRPVVVVLVRKSTLVVQPAAGEAENLDGSGAFAVLDAGRDFALRNVGAGEAEVAVVEVR
jgi:hypothetical protein